MYSFLKAKNESYFHHAYHSAKLLITNSMKKLRSRAFFYPLRKAEPASELTIFSPLLLILK